MTTSLVENSAAIVRATFANDPVLPAEVSEVGMALVDPPGMRLAADAE